MFLMINTKQVINFFRVWYSAVVACWDMVENWIALNFKSHWKLNWADWHIKFFKFFKVLFQCLLVKLTVSGEKKRISKHLVSYDFGLFDFIEKLLIGLAKNIKKTLKDVINKDNRFALNNVNWRIK